MSIQNLKVRLIGVRPLLMNNPIGADPTHPLSKERKKITSKRVKTDADHEELAWLDFKTAIYHDGTRPIIPNRMIEGAIIGGAKKHKKGPAAKAGIVVVDTALIYDGPTGIKELYEDERFKDRSRVKMNGGVSTMKIRPKFEKWIIEAGVQFADDLLNVGDVMEILATSGAQCGVGDWRPQHGLFQVERA